MALFPIFIIDELQKESLEQLGTKEKFWFNNEGVKYLFKIGRPNTGEDWVEVVVAEICALLNMPHAYYSFAKFEDKTGTSSLKFVPNGGRLVHGNELLAKVYKSINIEYDENRFYKLRAYELRVIQILLSDKAVLPSLNIFKNDMFDSAFDVFIGYIILDCLISNQDRHHENWGLIVLGEIIFLAPTYDHASGLGSKESDAKKAIRISGQDPRVTVEKFVSKASTPFYNKGNKLSTYDSVVLCGNLNKEKTLFWLRKIENLNIDDISKIFTNIPNGIITDISIQFALEMLKENKKRLLKIKMDLENE